MDFNLVMKKLLAAFESEGIRYALMGGFALGFWGVHRATVDIDFLVDRDDLGKISRVMTELGYDCVHRTENVSQYVSPLAVFGEIDFIHAFRKISLSMMRRAEEKKIFGGSFTIRVLKPEDLIGLKVQAMANDKARWTADLADIESIMALHHKDLDWSDIEEYFALFGLEETAGELRRKYRGSH
ncbi:MAG: nucleotidyl transferase AbiEii/AbiGii toxin family protein [bacterium]